MAKGCKMGKDGFRGLIVWQKSKELKVKVF